MVAVLIDAGHQQTTSLTSRITAITSKRMRTATLFFNIVICFLFLLLVSLVIWFLMSD